MSYRPLFTNSSAYDLIPFSSPLLDSRTLELGSGREPLCAAVIPQESHLEIGPTSGHANSLVNIAGGHVGNPFFLRHLQARVQYRKARRNSWPPILVPRTGAAGLRKLIVAMQWA